MWLGREWWRGPDKQSPTPSCASDRSKGKPPNFTNAPGAPDTKEKTAGLKKPSTTRRGQNVSLQEDLNDYKISLNSLDCVTYVTEVHSLSSIYTELYITEGYSEGVNNQHEVWQLDKASKKILYDKPINCCDIFKPLLLGRTTEVPIRRVLTKGIAGIGKTFSVHKFTLDWAKGLKNQDVNLVVPFSFRELNLVRDEKHSLLTLIHVFHPTLKKVTAEQLAVWKVGFIFDGLDESRFLLKFNNIDIKSDVFNKNDIVYDVTAASSVDVLLTNLIKGNLLPSALLWITTRPAAAHQIPPECVDRATEVQGFTDPQKEKFFKKRFSNEKLANRIISHMKTSKSLHIMCHIPVFCWITSTVLDDIVKTDETGQLPKKLTGMYGHFLLVQTKRKKQKCDETHELNQQQLMEADREVLLKLGRLAFEQLKKGHIMFYQEDLEECRLGVEEASLYSGVCTEIFKRESVKFQKTVYSFVHLSIQEFLAAVYLFHCFTEKNMEVLEPFLGGSVSSLDDFLQRAIEKALESGNGHLDLFVRFLHGLSRESNQRLLGGLLGQTENSPESIQRANNNLKEMTTKEYSPERIINIFHCLMELNDHSVHQEIQQYLKSGDRSKAKLSESHCSALAFMLQMSEEVVDELDLATYNTSDEGRHRLIPAVRNSRKARLVDCNFNDSEVVASALSSNPSHLKQLDLSYWYLGSAQGLDLLCAGLKSPHCCLEILRLTQCWLSETCCEVLASALSSNPSLHLKELDLRFNVLKVSSLQLFSGLKTLQVKHGGHEHWMNPQLLTRYFHHLTLDRNTAWRYLSLSENNREVHRSSEDQYPRDHPDRFDGMQQVLCTEGLTGHCYWEVKWSGRLVNQLAVTYRGISRKGRGKNCLLGNNVKSWSLYYDNHNCKYYVRHNSKQTSLPVCSSNGSKRVAVYLDWPAGTLSFYEVSSYSLTHLYTFQNTFTEPLYAGFRLDDIVSSVCLCEQSLCGLLPSGYFDTS